MVSDKKIRRLRQAMTKGKSQRRATLDADINRKTARRYLRLGKLPSEAKIDHTWRTRTDPFVKDWDWVRAQLEVEPRLEAKTLFEELQRRHPGVYQDGQLRTLQRKIKHWRAVSGPAKEIFFAQHHEPGELCSSDFTHMKSLAITIGHVVFDHLLYHFVLTYSNWEAVTICSSESFESLSEGLQNALWQLQRVPKVHLTDSLSAAVKKLRLGGKEFTVRYETLLRHLGLEGRHTQSASPNENGDVESRNNRLKKAIDQALMLRGSREFASQNEYECFLHELIQRLNAARRKRLTEELALMHRLPERRFESVKRLGVRVSAGGTISVQGNIYSVHSRLRGEEVEVRLSGETVQVWYGQKKLEEYPRFRGRGHARIDYRHIIDVLVTKPGAFEHYRYKAELFPTHYYRLAYDALKDGRTLKEQSKAYLLLLKLAAHSGETLVEQAIKQLAANEEPISYDAVHAIVTKPRTPIFELSHAVVAPVDLSLYERVRAGGRS